MNVFRDHFYHQIEDSAWTGAEGGIRTHEPLRDRLLKPTPLTWLGDLCAGTPVCSHLKITLTDKYVVTGSLAVCGIL